MMLDKIKIAAAQIDPKLMRSDENLGNILSFTKEAAANGASLVVFPECGLTGYVFSSRQETMPFAETIPGPSTEKIATLCRQLGVYVVFGLLEKEDSKLFNAAAFLGPQGLIGKYKKTHLPFLGVDRFVDIGDSPFQVYPTPIGNIGLFICYDIVFPESSRVMALMGADILAHPTNFPTGAGDKITNYVINTRAIENTVHLISTNRVGTEEGYLFSGLSKIVAASGKTIALASSDKEEIIYGEVSLKKARQKHLVFKAGEWEVDRIKDRRPELYGLITQPKTEKKWGYLF